MSSPPINRVLVLHGLWMTPLALRGLTNRLQAAGFEAEPFKYPSVTGGPDVVRPRLTERLATVDAVVAHSLGGLMTLETLRAKNDLPVQRVVCLGSPLSGSAAARLLSKRAATSWAVGRSAKLLCAGCEPWVGRAQVGMIAGRKPLGLGGLVTRFDGPHDGTVALNETRLDGLADHVVLNVSHTGLVFSPAAAQLAVNFLRHGRFAA